MKSRSSTASTPSRTTAKPGATLKKLRIKRGWTLKEMSRRTAYPVSTLSKIENDRVSLTYDKLTRISAALEVDFSSLFGATEAAPEAPPLHGRRSITRAGEGRSIESKNYFHVYPATELLNKRLIPIIVDNLAHSLEEFGDLIQHSGEECTRNRVSNRLWTTNLPEKKTSYNRKFCARRGCRARRTPGRLPTGLLGAAALRALRPRRGGGCRGFGSRRQMAAHRRNHLVFRSRTNS